MIDYVLVNLKEDLEDRMDTLLQLQDDIPEENPNFLKIEKIVNHIEHILSELD